MFYKIVAFKSFVKFTGKYSNWSLLLMKFKTLMVATLLKTTAEQVFSCEFRQIFKKNFFTECLLTTAFDIVHLISLFYFFFQVASWRREGSNCLFICMYFYFCKFFFTHGYTSNILIACFSLNYFNELEHN